MPARSFTLYWSHDKLAALEKKSAVGKPLSVLFGGPHVSQPRFSTAGVAVDDVIMPVTLVAGEILLLGCLTVKRIIKLEKNDGSEIPPECSKAVAAAQHFQWTCADEIVVGEGSPLAVDRRVPLRMVPLLRFENRRGVARALKDLDKDGRLLRTFGIQGLYRLSLESAKHLQALFSN